MNLFSDKLINFAKKVNAPLYAVGGFVRNYLISNEKSTDIDLCAPIKSEQFCRLLNEEGFSILAEYKRTGTVVFTDGENRYEYSSFRSESYAKGGEHIPSEVNFTSDIVLDALRRDFNCNALYMSVKSCEILDPLGRGIEDIKNKTITTTRQAKDVFSSDGLRLLRLARFCAELNFKPSKEVLKEAKNYAENILDISKERIFDELNKILISDIKYSFSDKKGHYNGLKILDQIGVLELVLPQIILGKGMEQRKDYHSYDVFEHTLKCVLYAKPNIRLSALLHDVGKPFVMMKTGKFYAHDVEGELITRQILTEYKASKKIIEKTAFLTRYHMYDLDLKTSESKIRAFIIKNFEYFFDLLDLKQADFSACKDDLSTSPTVVKWEKIYENMKLEGVPFSIKELNISAKDLIEIGFNGCEIKNEQQKLLKACVQNLSKNQRESLLKLAKRHFLALKGIKRDNKKY